ncbi:hypothetical protein IWW36_004775, partial [Coemansia brasiliensis]
MSRKRSRSASSPSLSQHSTPSSLTSLWIDEDMFDSPPLKKRSYSLIGQEAFLKCESGEDHCMPEQEYLLDIPDSIIGASNISQMDIATKCRLKRECLFDDSLMKKMRPKFYHGHFMKYPALNISFSKSEQLNRLIRAHERVSDEPDDTAAKYKDLPLRMFEALSDFISNCYGRYILLVDEYDIPFTSIYLAKWSKDDKQAARNIMKLMYHTMLKHLVKGVLFGVFEVPLVEMGSGANNIKEIRMVPTDEKDIQASILAAESLHSGDGLDALTDSFWFNAKEVEQMLDQ